MAARTPYLERYVAGEYERVWDELVALGAEVREEPLYSDALAVARETMRRARRNVELLLPRLEAVGFELGYAWVRTIDPQAGSLDELGKDGPFAPPPADIADRLRELEGTVGPIPLSIRAWFETIGMVDLVGRPPRRWGVARGEESTEEKWAELEQGRPDPFAEDPSLEWCGLDPLCIWPIDDALAAADAPSSARDPADPRAGPGYLPLAPDAEGKYLISGGGPVGIEVPSGTADAAFVDGMPFVEYLRLCFRWGGLPGLRAYLGPMATIAEDVRRLTRDLLQL